MADLTPDLQVRLSWGLIAESFHSLQSLSVSCFHVILGLPGPRFPSTCMSKAVLIAPLEHSTCPYHRSLLSFRMRSRSSMPSRTSSSLDLVVTVSCGLTLQICLIIALSFRCRRWRFGFVSGQVSLAHKSCTHGHVFWKRGGVIVGINSRTEWKTVQIQIVGINSRTEWKTADPDQLIWIYSVCKGRVCPGSARPGVRGIDTLSGEVTLSTCFCLSSEKGLLQKKRICSLGIKFFPVRVNTFSEGA